MFLEATALYDSMVGLEKMLDENRFHLKYLDLTNVHVCISRHTSTYSIEE